MVYNTRCIPPAANALASILPSCGEAGLACALRSAELAIVLIDHGEAHAGGVAE